MIYDKKTAQLLGMSKTIDLRYDDSLEYVKDNSRFHRNSFFITLFLSILLIIAIGITFVKTTNAEANFEKKDVKTEIRQARLEACKKALEKSNINEESIYGQNLVIRCATYLTMVYAYESNYGKSNMCLSKNNCWGIKGNGVEYPAGFISFSSHKEGREYFAKKYFQFHYKKKIKEFVYSRSTTDRNSYINFMNSKWKNYYSELKTLYLLNKIDK